MHNCGRIENSESPDRNKKRVLDGLDYTQYSQISEVNIITSHYYVNYQHITSVLCLFRQKYL